MGLQGGSVGACRVSQTTLLAACPFLSPASAPMPPTVPSALRLLRLAAIPMAFVVALLAPALFGLRSLASTDQLYLQEPWSNQADAPGDLTAGLTWDTYDFFQPRWIEQRERLMEGDLPMVGTTYPGAEPLASLPITGMLDPLHLPWLVLPGWLAPGFTKALQLLVALGGMAAWCRRLGLSRRAALVGGLAYASSGFITYWTGWPQSNTAAVIPVVFFALEGVLQRPTARRVAGLAAAFAWLLATGFPSVALYTVLVAVPYALVRLAATRPRSLTAWRRPVGALAGAGLLGALVMVVQLQPLRDLVAWNLLRRDGKLSATAPVRTLLSTLFPHFEGVPNFHEGPRIEPSSGQYFVGLSVMGWALFGCTRARHRLPRGVFSFAVGGTVAIMAVVYIGGPFMRAVQLLPFMSQNPFERMMCMVSLLLALLAAAGVEAWWLGDGRHPRLSPRVGRVLFAGVGGGVLLLAVAVAVRRWSIIPWSAALALAMVAVAAGGTGWLWWRARGGHGTLTRYGVPVLVALEGVLFVLPNLGFIERDDFFPPSTSVTAAADMQGTDRVDGERALPPGVGATYGLRTFSGHGFISGEWYDLLSVVHVTSTISLTYSRFGFFADEANSPVLDRVSVRYLFRPLAYLPGAGEPVAAEASGDSDLLTVTTDVEGAYRGLIITLSSPLPADATMRVAVDGVDTTGRSLAGDAGNPAFAAVVAGEDVAAGDSRELAVTVHFPNGVPAGVDADVVVVRPVDDGQRLVHTSDGAIWERLDALPRYRWASDADVSDNIDDRLSWLRQPQPADTVLLDAAPTVQPTGDGSVVSVDEAEPESRTIRTDSDGPGLLVIADAYRNGWVAYVDGVETPVVRADHALMAVEVPAGQHTVRLEYTPPGWPTAWRLSLLALLIVVALAVWPTRPIRRNRSNRLSTTSTSIEEEESDEH